MEQPKFHIGDRVMLLPYNAVDYHHGISRETWERMQGSVMTINHVSTGYCVKENCFIFLPEHFILATHNDAIQYDTEV